MRCPAVPRSPSWKTKWSFPSGHAAGSFAVYALLAYLVLRERHLGWRHLLLAAAILAAILAVGFTRVLLQVHYLSDVLAGYLVAGAWLCLWIAAIEFRRATTRTARSNARAGE